MNNPLLGKLLRERRKICGLTQKKVASAMMLSEKTISAYENGQNEPDIATLERILSHYGLPLSVFYSRLEERRKKEPKPPKPPKQKPIEMDSEPNSFSRESSDNPLTVKIIRNKVINPPTIEKARTLMQTKYGSDTDYRTTNVYSANGWYEIEGIANGKPVKNFISKKEMETTYKIFDGYIVTRAAPSEMKAAVHEMYHDNEYFRETWQENAQDLVEIVRIGYDAEVYMGGDILKLTDEQKQSAIEIDAQAIFFEREKAKRKRAAETTRTKVINPPIIERTHALVQTKYGSDADYRTTDVYLVVDGYELEGIANGQPVKSFIPRKEMETTYKIFDGYIVTEAAPFEMEEAVLEMHKENELNGETWQENTHSIVVIIRDYIGFDAEGYTGDNLSKLTDEQKQCAIEIDATFAPR